MKSKYIREGVKYIRRARIKKCTLIFVIINVVST